MACDYQGIRVDNERRYGTDIGRIGPMLLADRYDDRIHFIFELLQNAEDALARRRGWNGSRAVSFQLTETELRVSHFGQPFDEADVRGICGIAEGTKDLTAIGRFGIGFKSVYAFTDRPEVHSGAEDFAIESFVWPVAAPPIDREPDETVILIPLKVTDKSCGPEIASGLQELGATTLLFLRQIEEIRWSVDGGRSGLYLRESKDMVSAARRVTVVGQAHGMTEIDDDWLVFSRPVSAANGREAGYVEAAFSLVEDEGVEGDHIGRLETSPLAVFFPTILETHLGFLVQGPYRTTPSRDNVPRTDRWNQHLVSETASLVTDALCWLRDHGTLDVAALRCLPLDPSKFGDGNMFTPLFEKTKEALSRESLLPRSDGGYLTAARALIGRTQELRTLFTPAHLAALFRDREEPAWLSGHITQDRTPELRRFLMQQLDVVEVTPEAILPQLEHAFLEAQSDEWIIQLYEFLNGQAALHRRLDKVPLIRLENGKHVQAQVDSKYQAFLPGTVTTGFPTVRAAVCAPHLALEFLKSLGLTEPDPVDDVIRNVLPKYGKNEVDVDDQSYEVDIRRILTAFATDSKALRDKLVTALRETAFVMAVDAGDKSKRVSKPGDVYLATERLKALFEGVKNVLLVDDEYSCLRGEGIRELLEACGATRYLQPIPEEDALTWQQRREIRRKAGLERETWHQPISDSTLRGLDELLGLLPELELEKLRNRASILWDALADVESRRGSGAFVAEYVWGYSHETKSASFDAAFVRRLNETGWVPDANGELHRPELVLFDSLSWKSHSFLQSTIRFKAPLIEALAREAGIELGLLDLLKKLGVTSKSDLLARLFFEEEPAPSEADCSVTVEDALSSLLGDTADPTPPAPDPTATELPGPEVGARGTGAGRIGPVRRPADVGNGRGRTRGASRRSGARRPVGGGARPFISYVGAHPNDDELDPDGLDHAARMALEEAAIQYILHREPYWKRTATHNPGYDLFQEDDRGQARRWCEVKAMTGALIDRPVGLSHTQFEAARINGDAYWLYVVEKTGTAAVCLVRIQDPAGKARTFTFDRGWISVADNDVEHENWED